MTDPVVARTQLTAAVAQALLDENHCGGGNYCGKSLAALPPSLAGRYRQVAQAVVSVILGHPEVKCATCRGCGYSSCRSCGAWPGTHLGSCSSPTLPMCSICSGSGRVGGVSPPRDADGSLVVLAALAEAGVLVAQTSARLNLEGGWGEPTYVADVIYRVPTRGEEPT